MNTCILMATIIRNPELRYTQENQTPIAQMLVEFPGSRPEDPPHTLKVVAWGNLGTEIQQTYSEGDRLILEGRLSMQMVDRPEGFKEKRAELIVSRVHPLEKSAEGNRQAANPIVMLKSHTGEKKVIDLDSYKSAAKTESAPKSETLTRPISPAPVLSDTDLDDIPF